MNQEEFSQLNEFSRNFASALFEAHPSWRERAQINPNSEQPGVLLVTVPAPPPLDENGLWVTTDEGEITVGFDAFHWHFGAYQMPAPELHSEALAFTSDILEERWVVGVLMTGDRWRASKVLRPGSRFVVPEDHTGYLISWRGTYNLKDVPPGVRTVGGGPVRLADLSPEEIRTLCDDLTLGVEWVNPDDSWTEWVLASGAPPKHRRRFEAWLDSMDVAPACGVWFFNDDRADRSTWSRFRASWCDELGRGDLKVVSAAFDWVLEYQHDPSGGIARFARRRRPTDRDEP